MVVSDEKPHSPYFLTSIQPITKAVGASYYVGTDEENQVSDLYLLSSFLSMTLHSQVVIQVIPGIILAPDIEAYWQFL